jgi:hypothetical protein
MARSFPLFEGPSPPLVEQLPAHYFDPVGGFDADVHGQHARDLFGDAANPQHDEPDVVVEIDRFAGFSIQHEHSIALQTGLHPWMTR